MTNAIAAINYLDPENPEAAENYVSDRAADAAALLNEMRWEKRLTGALRAEIYGHSILWDIKGVLHSGKHSGCYEMRVKGDDEPYAYLSLQQVLAYVLAANW